jgi:hypothetical protein
VGDEARPRADSTGEIEDAWCHRPSDAAPAGDSYQTGSYVGPFYQGAETRATRTELILPLADPEAAVQWPRNKPETTAKPFFALEEKSLTSTQRYGCPTWSNKGTAMTAIAKALSNAIPAISTDVDILRTIVLFCGVGLLASLILVVSGLSFLPTESEVLNVMNWI